MKNGIKAILQAVLGYERYLRLFAWFKVKTLRHDRRERGFFHFLSLLPEDGVVLDVGANLGFLCVYLARRVRSGRVLAFEPLPDNHRVLRWLLRRTRTLNVDVHTCALGDRDGTVSMVLPIQGHARQQGLGHVVSAGDADEPGIPFNVPLRRLDALPELEGARVAAIKMDVENFERFVLRGATGILERDRPVVYLELWDNENRSECFAIATSLGYAIMVFDGRRLVAFDPASHRHHGNFFLMPAAAVRSPAVAQARAVETGTVGAAVSLPASWARRLSTLVGLGLLLAAQPGLGDSEVALGLHAGRDDSIAQYEAFGEWLGAKVMYRVVFCGMASWDDIASPWFLNGTRRWLASDPDRVEVISVPLLPKPAWGAFDAIVAGDHDDVFASLARKVAATGHPERVIVRLGWEGNGDWYPWAYARNPEGYRQAFRRVVRVMRAVAPELRFEWCVTCKASRRGGPARWDEGYPGDDVVDIVSLDIYDEYVRGWDDLLRGEGGLQEFREFAIAHDKPEAYPEWSCSTNPKSRGRGDNAAFVENMAAWFRGRPGKVVYQAYWNTNADGPKARLFGKRPTRVPRAAATYRRLFGARGEEDRDE